MNSAFGEVTAAPTPAVSGHTLVVDPPGGWPDPPFQLTIAPAGASRAEIRDDAEYATVTANSSGTLTIDRATEGPNAARTILVGDEVWAGPTAKTIDDILAGGPFLGMTIAPTPSSLEQGLFVDQSGHGTFPSGGAWAYDFNKIYISGDDVDASGQAAYGVHILHGAGGSNMTGQRVTHVAELQQYAFSSPTNPIPYWSPRQAIVYGLGENGTNTGAGSRGSYFGDNIVIFTSGPNCFELCGLEIDIAGTAAATQKYVFGISLEAIHVNPGVTHDAAIEMHAGEWDSGGVTYGPSGGWRYGIAFDEIEGNGHSPISTDGTMIGVFLSSLSSISVANGIDFSKVNFSGYAFRSPGFYVAPDGNIGVGVVATTGGGRVDVRIPATNSFGSIGISDPSGNVGIQLAYLGSTFGGARQNHGEIVTQIGPIYFRPGDTSDFAQIDTSGNILTTASVGLTGSRITKVWTTDLEVTNAPTLNGVAIPSISSTNTLTNKRKQPRTGTTTSSATPTINTDNVDQYYLTAQTVDITSFTTNLSGTPVKGEGLLIGITGTAARAITWGASFVATTVALPTTTVTTATLLVLFIWDGAHWACVGTA